MLPTLSEKLPYELFKLRDSDGDRYHVRCGSQAGKQALTKLMVL
jgi:hypothetical protein